MDRVYTHRYDEAVIESEEYFAHVLAMTGEDLHGKGEIAAELAYRDRRIAKLEAELDESWRPIHSAPKDREILLKGAHGSIANGCWSSGGWVWPYIKKEPLYWRELAPPHDGKWLNCQYPAGVAPCPLSPNNKDEQ